MNLLDQPKIVADLLDEVCQSRETLSAVTLTIALVDRGRLSENGDPLSLVVSVVEDLNEAGLVTYRLRSDWAQIPLSIKATPLGYKIAGYERETVEVGSRAAQRGAPRQNGPTDFRSQPLTTWGDAIERMSLADHLDLYPDHRAIHPHPWECGPYGSDSVSTRDENNESRRRERAERVVESLKTRGGYATFTELQEQLGVAASYAAKMVEEARALGLVERIGEPSTRGTYWRLVEAAPDIEPLSSRETILEVLGKGRVSDDHALVEAMAQINPTWRRLGAHSIDHQLFSMEKAGLIEMDVKREGSVQRLRNIRLAKRASAEAFDAVPVFKPDWNAAMDVVLDRFPILDSLRAREQARSETSRRADAFLSAASVLDGVDQEESDRLMALANDLANGATLAPVEAEYLRFAEMKEETR